MQPQTFCKPKPYFHIMASNIKDYALDNTVNTIDHTSLNPALKVITVMSISKGPIKTLVAYNLASHFADQGYKTLLIEGDLRNPSFKSLFNIAANSTLIDVLDEKQTVDLAYAKDFDILPASLAFEDIPSILLGRAFKRLLTQLKSTYDKIIIDTPSLTLHKDAFILNDYACGTIVVHDTTA